MNDLAAEIREAINLSRNGVSEIRTEALAALAEATVRLHEEGIALRTTIVRLEQQRQGWQAYLDMVRAGKIHVHGAESSNRQQPAAQTTAAAARSGHSDRKGRRNDAEGNRQAIRRQ